jgi:hypothetical protein
MRLLLVLLGLPLLALQAHAQTAPPLQTGSPPPITAPADSVPSPVGPGTPQHHRMSWKQHFVQANLAHDGHLTLQEASGGYPTVARHFTEIDADKKGYVTEEDITNWHKLQRAMRHSDRTGQGLQPRHAIQQGLTTPQPIHTSASGSMLPMTTPDASTTGQQATTK